MSRTRKSSPHTTHSTRRDDTHTGTFRNMLSHTRTHCCGGVPPPFFVLSRRPRRSSEVSATAIQPSKKTKKCIQAALSIIYRVFFCRELAVPFSRLMMMMMTSQRFRELAAAARRSAQLRACNFRPPLCLVVIVAMHVFFRARAAVCCRHRAGFFLRREE